MSSRPAQTALTRILAGACIILAAIIGIELVVPAAPTLPADAESDPIVPGSLDVADFSAPPMERFSEILSRPLFFEDRRLPPLPSSLGPEAIPEEPLHLSLEGVAISSDSRIALLRDGRGNELIQLAEGMSHNGWVLESVNSRGAAFRRGDDVEQLELESAERNSRRRLRR